MSSVSRRTALCACAVAIMGDAAGFSTGSILPCLRRPSLPITPLAMQGAAPGVQGKLGLADEPLIGSAAVTRRDLMRGAAMAFASCTAAPQRVLAEEEEEEDAVAGGSRENAFDSTERVLAPKGDDPLDSERFRKRQDLKILKPWTPEGELTDLTIPVKGKSVKIGQLLGDSATIVMNIKLDDPETITQIPALKALVARYQSQGLRAILVPTDQGDYEPDDSATVRIKMTQQFGLKSSTKGPLVVTDKTDIVGKFCLPFYRYLTTNKPNPNDVSRITLNYEKFLLNADGDIIRRYPRSWGADRMEKDVKAVLEGRETLDKDPRLLFAWEQADKEATRSMYSFRKHYNYYDQQEAGKDWSGTKAEYFTEGNVEARFKGVTKGKPLVISEGD